MKPLNRLRADIVASGNRTQRLAVRHADDVVFVAQKPISRTPERTGWIRRSSSTAIWSRAAVPTATSAVVMRNDRLAEGFRTPGPLRDGRAWSGAGVRKPPKESGQPTISQNSPIFGLNPREQNEKFVPDR